MRSINLGKTGLASPSRAVILIRTCVSAEFDRCQRISAGFHRTSAMPVCSGGASRNLRSILVSTVMLISAVCFAHGAVLSDPAVDSYNVHVGTQTFAGLYQFTTNTLLLETAQALRAMGSDVLKMYLGNAYPRQYHYALGPNITNLVSLVRDDPSCRAVFDMPFRNIVAWAYPFGNGDAPFTDGNYNAAEQADDYSEMYGLAQYLLSHYNNSGKTFYLGHWEGDGYLSVNNWSTNPSPAVLQGMIAWENVRQKAIDDAKAALGFTNVNVFYYAEANRVRDAMLNGPTNNQRVINMVIPYVTNLDFISYSSYDAMNLDAASLYSTLDYMQSKMPMNKSSLGQRLWIGEYGWGGLSTDSQEPLNRAYIQRLLQWGPRFILFWEIYNNETNRNFCLIDSNGVKTASWYLHRRFINQARLSVASFKETTGRLPTDADFATLMIPALNQPLPAPVPLFVSNAAAVLSGNSALMSAQVAQGVYGDDQAAVWAYWGRVDSGTNKATWEFKQQLGFNTNFNPATFSLPVTGLVAQTNYYFRFYATNSSGEAWAPASSVFWTRTLNPDEYGSRLQIRFAGYTRSQSLAGFPALVELGTNIAGFNYDRFGSTNGLDLRFTDSSGSNVVPYEIDEWNPAGTSFVWVWVPQLNGTNNSIWAYWGNPLATNFVDWGTNISVWSDALAVWHLKESKFPYLDSAGQHSIAGGVNPGSVAGVIGRAIAFDGSTQYLDTGALDVGPAFTLSAWIKVDPASTGIQTIFANKKGGWNTDGFALYVNTYQTSDHKLLFETGDGTNGMMASTAAQTLTPGVWHHVAAAVDLPAASARLYVDGIDLTQASAVQPGFNTASDLNIGRFTDGSFLFRGDMDEVRIEKGALSADWIWTEWSTAGQNRAIQSETSVDSRQVLLSVALGSPGGILASWAAAGVGLSLYYTTDLQSPQWLLVTNGAYLQNNQWVVSLARQSNSVFFRLQSH